MACPETGSDADYSEQPRPGPRRGFVVSTDGDPVDLSVEVTGDTVTVTAVNVHPIDYDSAARTVRDLAVELHRALVNDDAA